MAKPPKVLGVQLFVLLHAPSIVLRPPYNGAWVKVAYIGRRNVSSTFKTIYKRRWVAFALAWPERRARPDLPLFALTQEGRNVLWNACCEAMGV